MGSSGAFRYRMLVGLKRLVSHAHLAAVAQTILGSAGAKVEFANAEAHSDPDDERELFAVRLP